MKKCSLYQISVVENPSWVQFPKEVFPAVIQWYLSMKYFLIDGRLLKYHSKWISYESLTNPYKFMSVSRVSWSWVYSEEEWLLYTRKKSTVKSFTNHTSYLVRDYYNESLTTILTWRRARPLQAAFSLWRFGQGGVWACLHVWYHVPGVGAARRTVGNSVVADTHLLTSSVVHVSVRMRLIILNRPTVSCHKIKYKKKINKLHSYTSYFLIFT